MPFAASLFPGAFEIMEEHPMKNNRRRFSGKPRVSPSVLDRINPNAAGRKTDVSDCEWIRELHSVGLLRGSFRPVAGITALRSYLRHRQTLIETTSTCVLRMQKALVQMNLQLRLAVSDITGVTGLHI